MTTREEITNTVIECVADSLALEIDEVKTDTRLITDLSADSLDIMDIMFMLEEKFDIKLAKEDFNFFNKIGMEREEAVVDEVLTVTALEKLKKWLPHLDTSLKIKPSDLGNYLSVESLVVLVEEYQNS